MNVSGICSVNKNSDSVSPSAGTNRGTDFATILSNSEDKSSVELDDIFKAASEKYGVPVNLLEAVAKAESNFNPDATSSCGAMGIMQLMPGTAHSLGVSDAYDPEQNIMGGAKYLSQLLSEFQGNTKLAVAAYNAGPGSVVEYNGIPPYAETENYVDRVMGYCNGFSNGSLSAGGITVSAGGIHSASSSVSKSTVGNGAALLSALLMMNVESHFFSDIGDSGEDKDGSPAIF